MSVQRALKSPSHHRSGNRRSKTIQVALRVVFRLLKDEGETDHVDSDRTFRSSECHIIPLYIFYCRLYYI